MLAGTDAGDGVLNVFAVQIKGAHQGGHATARFLEGFLKGSLKEVLLRRVLRRVLRRRFVRVSKETEVLRRFLEGGGVIEGA